MLLKKLTIKNLRSFEHLELIFPKGSTLLSGDIGSGKTTILLAIEFALFGLQPSQKGSSLLRNNKETGSVILEFEVKGKNIVIERVLKKGKKSITQDYASITIDNEKFEESVTEIKSKVLDLLSYPQEFSRKTNILYKFTVYTPQEEMKQIILEPGDVRLNTLRHVFGIDKYRRIQENASLLASKIREKIRINEAIISNLDELKELLKQKETNLLSLKQKKDTTENEHKKSITSREQIESVIKEIQNQINKKNSLETQKSKTEIIISEKNNHLLALNNDIHKLNLEIQEANKNPFNEERFNSLKQRIEFQENKFKEIEKEYIQILSKINTNQSKKSEISSLKNKIQGLDNCPTCLQIVSQEYKSNILNNAELQLKLVENTLLECQNNKDSLIKQLEQSKNSIKDFTNQMSLLENSKIRAEAIKEKQSRITVVINQKQILENQIKKQQYIISDTIKSIKEYEKYDLIFTEKNIQLIEAKKTESNLAIKNAEIKKEIQFSKKEIDEKQYEITEKEKIKDKNEKLKELSFWISEKFIEIVLFTEKQIMMTLKDEFSRLFSKWFSILVTDSLTAKLDDNFSPIIEQKDYEIEYNFLSGGERTAIALAYRLSLNQVINSLLSDIKTSSLVILDEPTDGFSSQQLDKMRDVLDQLDIEQLILVSHEQKMEEFVDNIIRVTKEDHVSRIEG